MKKIKLNIKKILKYLGIISFMAMLVLIYFVSPRITVAIQNMAKYIYELDSNYITRVVELILAVTLIIAINTTNKTKKGVK